MGQTRNPKTEAPEGRPKSEIRRTEAGHSRWNTANCRGASPNAKCRIRISGFGLRNSDLFGLSFCFDLKVSAAGSV